MSKFTPMVILVLFTATVIYFFNKNHEKPTQIAHDKWELSEIDKFKSITKQLEHYRLSDATYDNKLTAINNCLAAHIFKKQTAIYLEAKAQCNIRTTALYAAITYGKSIEESNQPDSKTNKRPYYFSLIYKDSDRIDRVGPFSTKNDCDNTAKSANEQGLTPTYCEQYNSSEMLLPFDRKDKTIHRP